MGNIIKKVRSVLPIPKAWEQDNDRKNFAIRVETAIRELFARRVAVIKVNGDAVIPDENSVVDLTISAGIQGVKENGTLLTPDDDGVVNVVDTDTHRAISLSGTQKMGNSTTTLDFIPGDNMEITYSTGGHFTFKATDTTYTSQSASSGSNTVSLCTRGEKYTWNNKADDSAVVHNTGAENISGAKTFKYYNIDISSNSSRYKSLRFLTNAGTVCGFMRFDTGDASETISVNRYRFVQYSPQSTPDTTVLEYTETYYLPMCTKGLAESKTYNILTTKSAVDVSEGGTGATTAAGALTNLGAADDTKVVHNTGTESIGGVKSFTNTTQATSGGAGAVKLSGGLYAAKRIFGAAVYGAVWNDYAECRQTDKVEPGRCVTESPTGIMTQTVNRLQAGCRLVSDTYGMLIGETDEAQTPIAIAGRVLAFPFGDVSKFHLGDAVCSAPGGTVDVMTRKEIMEFPERIVGTVSEIPTYDVWYGNTKADPVKVPVNGRIWIYVR